MLIKASILNRLNTVYMYMYIYICIYIYIYMYIYMSSSQKVITLLKLLSPLNRNEKNT